MHFLTDKFNIGKTDKNLECRDSLDEGYDPDETLQVTVYDNEEGQEEIKIKSSGMYYSSGKNNYSITF